MGSQHTSAGGRYFTCTEPGSRRAMVAGWNTSPRFAVLPGHTDALRDADATITLSPALHASCRVCTTYTFRASRPGDLGDLS